MNGELDAAYVADAGQAIAHYCVGRGRSCEIAYTPGNGTLYELVFTPVGLGLDRVRDWMDHDKRRSISEDRAEWAHEADALVLVSWLGHGAWQVDLRSVWHDSYIAEKFDRCSVGDAAALRQLLLAVAERARLRGLRSVS